jgi:PAS domain S-box-containing protein
VIITNSEGRIEYVNPKFTSITGYSVGDVVGKRPSILKSGETAEEEYQRLQETVASGKEWRGVFQNRKKNGELFWASASISPVTDELGRMTHILAVEEDITERMKAEAQIQQQLDRLGALRAIDMAISASLDPQITFNILLQHVIKQLGVDAANILMFNKQTQMLEFACGVGFRTDALRHTHLRIGKGYAGKAALERRMVAMPDLASDLGEFTRAPQLKQEEFVSYFAVPLCAKGQVKGVLETFHRSPLNPDEEWIHFLEALAAQGAIALDNASLFEDLQRSNEELVVALDTMLEGWGRSLELREVGKEGHTERVAMNTVRLAREIGIRDAEMVHIRRGAILHDIGEIGVPEHILLKPGSLSDQEMDEIRRHPEYAHQLLSDVRHLQPSIDIPYCHHERWDGKGYPRGLRESEIPLAARIFAVADVWDAMRSDRPYRKARTDREALAYIQEQSGSHFDPKIVELFLLLVDEMQ